MKARIWLIFIILSGLLIPDDLFSEGTKQILLSDAGHGKIQVNPSFNNFAWYSSSGNSAAAEFRLHIQVANIGETIYYGFGDPLNNNNDVVTDVKFRIKDPAGTVVVGPLSVPLSGAGHINTFNEAVAGPSAIAGSSGYNALSYTPTITGDFFIEFNFPTGWPTGHDRTKFRYFDITVASAANEAINGRVWSKAWQMTADDQAPPNGEYTFWGKLYPYSDDGIVTSINFNGMEPFVFAVSCNPYGCKNEGNLETDRQSVYNANSTLTQYKIFLNDPDSLVYPTGILGNVIQPIVITPECSGSATISINVTKAGSLNILLDINPLAGKQAEDVEIPWTAVAGINIIPWDGLNGLGVPIINGTTFNVVVTYINGLTNLPIYDVERNPSGFVIEVTRPTGQVPTVFWDDSQIPGGGTNLTGCTPVLPSTGCHTWEYSIGNGNTINTWWYAVDTVQAPVLFTEIRLPPAPGPIQGVSALCPGATGLIYWINEEPNSSSYTWDYSGTGATITVINDTIISVNYANDATSGNITVSGINAQCGTGPAQTKAITVYSTPVVSLAPFPSVCIDLPPFPLTGGLPSGGTYTIGGIPVTIFNPALQGPGTFTVTYTFTDPGTGCTAFSSQPIVVNPLPAVTLSAFSSVCISVPPFVLTGGNPAGGTYSGTGVSGGVFSPALAGSGTFNITYTYTDLNGCVNSDVKSITVNPLPVITFPPLPDVCITLAPFPLTGATPAGGIYKGAGVTANIFSPSVAGPGSHILKYIYTNSNGCTDSTTQTITVDPLPDAPGAITGAPVLCQGTSGVIYSVLPVTHATSYLWTLTPSSAGTFTGSEESITVNWSPVFYGPVSITVRGINSCGDGPPSQGYAVMVNPKPLVSYTLCNDSVTTTTAKPFQLRGGLPLSGTYSGNGVNSVSGIFSPSAAGPGTHPILYTYNNSFGCSSSVVKNIVVVISSPFTCGNKIKDVRDNRLYNTIEINSQCWMAENLNYGRQITGSFSQRDNCIIEKYCYGDVSANCSGSGGLYQWDEMMQYGTSPGNQGICMPGWHVPDETDWNILFSNYINSGFAGIALKATGYSGFTALLKGAAFKNKLMNFDNFAVFFWSADSDGPYKAWSHGMNSYNFSVSYYPSARSNGFSVRCLKD